jgi:hypothetical protein
LDNERSPQAGQPDLERRIDQLSRAVRHQVVALWALVAILVVAYGTPWVLFFVHSIRYPDTSSIPGKESHISKPAAIDEHWDNDFYARSPEEKIRRATAILLTRFDKTGPRHRDIVTEILKRKPGIRLYYKVGDEFPALSHAPTLDCGDCDGQGSIVFMLGNPATMAFATTYAEDRLDGLGDMPLSEVRRLAAESASEEP